MKNLNESRIEYGLRAIPYLDHFEKGRIKEEFWHHFCPEDGPLDVLAGEGCSWCDAEEIVLQTNAEQGLFGRTE